MTDQRVLDSLTHALTTGIKHPGNAQTHDPAATMHLSTYRVHGYPPPLADMKRQAAQVLIEAILFHIDNDLQSVVIPKADLAQLRADLAAQTQARETLTEELENLAVRMNIP